MIGQPSLDRFSQPGPYERGRRGVKFLIETADLVDCSLFCRFEPYQTAEEVEAFLTRFQPQTQEETT